MNNSICPKCYFNSKNDFFEAGFDEKFRRIDVCAVDVAGYPHSKECHKYEPAHAIDEE